MKQFSLVVVAWALLLTGCGSKSPSVVGKWKIAPEVAAKDPAGTEKGFMLGFASAFKFEFKDDKTFAAPMSEGTYTVNGNKIEVVTTKAMGQDLTKIAKKMPPMTGDLSADGQSLTLKPPAQPNMPPELQSIKMVRDK